MNPENSTIARKWTADEKKQCIELYAKYQSSNYSDLSRRQSDREASREIQEDWEAKLDSYLLNGNKNGLRFIVEKDGSNNVDGIHQWWSYLGAMINKYGTADKDAIKHIKHKQTEMNTLKEMLKSVQEKINLLKNKKKECEKFLEYFPRELNILQSQLAESERQYHEFMRS